MVSNQVRPCKSCEVTPFVIEKSFSELEYDIYKTLFKEGDAITYYSFVNARPSFTKNIVNSIGNQFCIMNK